MKLVKAGIQLAKQIKFLILPFFLFIIYSYLSLSFLEFRRELENSLVSLGILVTIYYSISTYKLGYYYYLFFSFIVAITHYFKIIFYEVYGYKLSKSIVYTILETYTGEVSEYLASYFGLFAVVLTITFIIYMVYLTKYFSYKKIKVLQRDRLLLGLLYVGVLLVFYRGFLYKKYNLTYALTDAVIAYKQTQDNFDSKLKTKENSVFKNVTKTSNTPKTFVVIIGESTTRRHMGLYGYYRDNNPLLSARKNNLICYDSVLSTSAYTTSSLKQVLLHKKNYVKLDDYFDEEDEIKGSIVQLSNMAGFETYWLSNQRPVGVNETAISKIATAANKKIFVNYEDYDYESYDHKILTELDLILDDKPKNKMIFIHLMGTHWNFKHRYPKSFDKFNDIPEAITVNKKELQIINEYDNAILYNDFIVDAIISKVEKNKNMAYVTYFSDHGVDVFENVSGGVQHSDKNPTKPMYEIPYVIWFSDKYKNEINLEYKVHRKYVLSDFVHSFSQLSEIKFDEYEGSKSIFNGNYFFDKRKVVGTRLENIMYD